MTKHISPAVRGRTWPVDAVFLTLAMLATHGVWLFFDIFDATFDFPLHYRWAYDFEAALHQGVLRPNWAAFSRGRLGDPVFLYYVPLFYYLAAAINLVVNDLWLSIKIVVILSAFLSGIVILNFARNRGASNLSARLLAVLGIGLSSFLIIRGTINAYPWAVANLFLLTSIVALLRAQERPVMGRFLVLALSVAAMSATHTLTTAAFVLVVATGMLFQWASQDRSRAGFAFGLKVAGAILLGLALVAVFVLPSFLETGLISPERWDHTDTKGSTWFNSFSWPIFTEYTRFALVWVMPAGPFLLLPFVGLALYLTRPLTPAHLVLLWTGAIAFFLSTELSFKVWEQVSALHIFQRPFRFLSPLSQTMLLVLALSAKKLNQRLGQRRSDLLALAVTALALSPSGVMTAEYVWSRVSGIDSDRYVRATPLLMEDVYHVPEYLPAGAGPDWESWLQRGGWQEECRSLSAECFGGSITTQHYEWTVTLPASALMRFPLMMFPSWRVAVNGQIVERAIDPASGLLFLDLPDGKSRISVTWQDLPTQILGRWISLAALGILLLLLARSRLRRR
jgi:hypothetical protein